MQKVQRHRAEILQVLSRAAAPASSAQIASHLEQAGYSLGERADRRRDGTIIKP